MLQSYFSTKAPQSPLGPIVVACRRALLALGIASGMINLLTLTGSIFMMQVYDRVLGSQSLSTLIGLSLIALIAFVAQGALETIRGRMLSLISEKIDAEIGPAIHTAGLKASVGAANGPQDAMLVQRDLDSIRNFVGGTGLVAAFDVPWIPIYIIATTLLHPLFGLTTLISGIFLCWLTWKNERQTKPLIKEANDLSAKRNQLFDGIIRNGEVVVANGMGGHMAERLEAVQTKFLLAHRKAAFTTAVYGTSARTIRLMLQSLVLALGAYLALKGQISPGAIIGASIMIARALAPIDQAINNWKPFVAAREGHERLQRLISRFPERSVPMALPSPKNTFAVRDLAVVAPGGQSFAVAGVSFGLQAGQAAAIIGQSASGKSSLIRAIVGAWKPSRGFVEFDGTSPDQWAADVIGKSLGYMPQDVQLFEGTIAENISRFDPAATPELIRSAAVAAGLDSYIRQAFPQTGYNTVLTVGGSNLSGGQRQRVGLARALYGDPFIVVLDEPNSNLDRAGKEALGRAIRSVKERKGIVIVSAHDHNVLAECDSVLTLHLGQPEMFGPRDEVVKKWLTKHHPSTLATPTPQAAPPLLPTVAGAKGLLRPGPQPQQKPGNGSSNPAGANTTTKTSWSSGKAEIKASMKSVQPVAIGPASGKRAEKNDKDEPSGDQS